MFSRHNVIITNNEIAIPENKYIQNYLWRSYFHDSKIESIILGSKSNELKIVVTSEKDIDDSWDKLKGSEYRKRKFIRDNKEKFQYELIFEKCIYFNQEATEVNCDFLQCYFLDSSKLQIYNLDSGIQNYHLRIITTSGFIDTIFSKFKIRRINNEKIKIEKSNRNIESNFGKKFMIYASKMSCLLDDGSINQQKLKEYLINGSDSERCAILYYFVNYTDIDVIDNAREIMKLSREKYELSRAYSIRVLGKQGNENDIEILMEEFIHLERRHQMKDECFVNLLLPKREILDSIELISNFRNEN